MTPPPGSRRVDANDARGRHCWNTTARVALYAPLWHCMAKYAQTLAPACRHGARAHILPRVARFPSASTGNARSRSISTDESKPRVQEAVDDSMTTVSGTVVHLP